MATLIALLLALWFEQAQAPAPAIFITKEEHEEALKQQTAKNVVDLPIKASPVVGGKASVARLRRVKPEANALIHDYVTETYYIMSGSGTFVTGGSLGGAKPTDLSNVNAGMSQTGTRVGGESRRIRAGDIVIVPAGTPHSFSELDGPIEYLVYRFEPMVKK